MFFFSSRRRHTRFDCDWSSDVCSSDLQFPPAYVADSNGTPMHSWRVLILPYIEANHIYDRYDQTQPWDSATNRQLRSEEHTSELQSQSNLVCRLLLEKKKKKKKNKNKT